MSIKTKCSRCSQFFGAPDQTVGKVAKCPYCGAPNDIVDLTSDDDELAALIEEERKKVGGSKAASAFSDPLAPASGPAARKAPPQRGQTWRQTPTKKLDLETRLVDMAIGQVLAITVIVLGTGELIAAIATGQGFVNFLFGMFGWLLGCGAWREHQTRRRSPAAVQTWETVEFWIGIAVAIGVALWATFSFAMPAFTVVTAGKGFESRVVGYLAKMFLLWFALLAYGVGLFVVSGRQKVFTLASWTYVLGCGILLLFMTPFSDGLGRVRAYAETEPQRLFTGAPPNQSLANNPNQPPATNPAGGNQAENNPTATPVASTEPAAPDTGAPQPQPEATAQPAAEEQPPTTEKTLPQIAWQVVADPDPQPQVRPWIRQPAIPVPSSIDLAWPRAISSLVAVLNRNQSEPSAQLWDLSTACGKGLIRGSFDFKEAILLSRDGKYLGGNGEFGTEIWSFETGRLLARLPLDKRNNDVPVDFLPDQSILMLGNTSKSGQYKIWTFGVNPKVSKTDLPDGVIVDNRAAAISPGRRYLATFGQGIVWIVDLQKGELRGMLPVAKADDPSASNLEADLCFSPDGRELAGIFGGNQVSHLFVWALSDGSMTANFELPQWISNRDKGRVLECFPDNQGWLVDGSMLVDRSGQAWPIIRHDLRILGLSDNNHAIVANEQMLSTWALTRQADGRLKLATLEIQHDDLPAVMYPREFGAALNGDAFTRANRRYWYQAEVDILSADDSALLQTLRWCPILKQPALGVRWGTGVVVPMSAGSVAAATGPTGRLEDQVGAVGTVVGNELQNRIDSGAFGQAPQVGDPRLSGVVFLGSGTRNELLNMAKAMGLNAVVLFQLPQPTPAAMQAAGKRTDDQLKIHVIDIANKTEKEWSAPNTAPGASTGEPDPEELALCADDIGKYLDANYVLQPMPQLQAGDIAGRMKKMAAEAHDDRLPLFAEVRYDQMKGLLSNEEAVAALRTWLNNEQAQVMASGTPAQRRAMLEQWLKSNRG